jgi:ATP-dependent Zn protease
VNRVEKILARLPDNNTLAIGLTAVGFLASIVGFDTVACGAFGGIFGLLLADKATARRLRGLPSQAPGSLSHLDYQKAVHESGHAIVAFFSLNVRELVRVTIDKDGEWAGHLLYTFPVTGSQELRYERAAIAMAGLAAEAIVLGRFESGPGRNDLLAALEVAREIPVPKPPWEVDASVLVKWDVASPFRDAITEEEKLVLVEAYRRAKSVLLANRSLLEKMALHVVQKRTLGRGDLHEFLGARPWARKR